MSQLMISLDKKILDFNSSVAQRMIDYGKENELFIIIPDVKKNVLDLSPTVHVWSTGGNKLQQFCRLKKIGKKIIQDSRFKIQDSLITTQDPFFIGWVGWYLKKKFGIKLEVQLHGDFFSSYYKKHWFRLCLAKFIIKRADVVRVVGERVKNSIVNLGIKENKIIVRPVAVDVERIKNYQPKIELHQKYPGYDKIFLVLGRLEPVKNIEWLIDVFKVVVEKKNKYLLLIVGSGQEEQNLKLKIVNNKLQNNIKFETWTNDPISYLKTTDCVLFPSLSEGYGLVPTEANLMNTRIIMSDVGVANYELKPGDKVQILPINNKTIWLKAILSV